VVVDKSRIFKWNSTAWQEEASEPGGGDIRRIGGGQGGALWAVGTVGTLLQRDPF
jgi:hypothetical protein